ncbi:MAG: hypothetical protein ACOCV1_00135 [Bacillota bacterium]
MKNKKAFALTASVVGVIGLFIIALILIITLISSLTFKIYAIGGALIVLTIIYGLQGEINREKSMVMFSFIAVGAIIILLGSTGVIQSAFGTTTVMSIDNIQINGQNQIRIYGKAGGAEEIIIDFSKNELNDYLTEYGLEATKGVSGRITFEEQNKLFQIQQTENYFYKLGVKNIGTFTSCSTDNCKTKIPYGTESAGAGRDFSFTGFDCLCMYREKIGNIGQFTGSSDKEFKVKFKIGNQESILSEDDRSISVGSGVKVEWLGDLNSIRNINEPNYDILFKGSKNEYLINNNAYDKLKDTEQDFSNCAYQDKYTYRQLLLGSISVIDTNEDQLKNCIQTFNNKVETATINRDDQYLDLVEDRVEKLDFDGNKLRLYLSVPDTYPTFIITIDADKVGIKELSGIPDISRCLDDINLLSGEQKTKNIIVKNIGGNEGLFQGKVTCNNNDINGFVNDISVQKGASESMDITITGENTKDSTLNSQCSVKVTDLKSGESDSCIFNVGVQYNSGKECNPNEVICLDYNTKQICNDDGTEKTLIECEYQCSYINGEATCIDKEEDISDEDSNGNNGGSSVSCPGWWEYEAKTEEKDYGFAYWRAWIPGAEPETISVGVCKTHGWVYGLIIGGFLTLIIIAFAVTRKPKQQNYMRPNNGNIRRIN